MPNTGRRVKHKAKSTSAKKSHAGKRWLRYFNAVVAPQVRASLPFAFERAWLCSERSAPSFERVRSPFGCTFAFRLAFARLCIFGLMGTSQRLGAAFSDADQPKQFDTH